MADATKVHPTATGTPSARPWSGRPRRRVVAAAARGQGRRGAAGGRVVTPMPYTTAWYEERTRRFDVEAYSTVPVGSRAGAADGPRT
jgi:hypothetical protein